VFAIEIERCGEPGPRKRVELAVEHLGDEVLRDVAEIVVGCVGLHPGGMVFTTSGYPRNGGMPRNALLAFGVE
jgi:hypothetical protein